MFLRNEKGRKVLRITGRKSYFYVEGDGPYKSLFGQSLKRLTYDNPGGVLTNRSKHNRHYEANIEHHMRIRIDEDLRYGVKIIGDTIEPCEPIDVSPTIFFIDLEVESPPEIFPQPRKANYPIVNVGTIHGDKAIMYALEGSEEGRHQGVRGKNVEVMVFNDERNMLEYFLDYFIECDPDEITGWHAEGFDVLYLLRRMQKLGVPYRRMSPIGKVRFKLIKDQLRVNILGRVILDTLSAFQKIHSPFHGRLPSYRLSYVHAYLFKHEEREDFGDRIKYLRDREKYEQVADYCTQDVVDTLEIFEDIDVMRYFENIRKVVGCRVEDVLSNKRVVDVLSLRQAKEDNVVLPSVSYTTAVEKVLGGKVLEPMVGLHKYVAVYDLKALYPAIIMAKNISPEMIQPDRTFRKDEVGFIPKIMKKLIVVRQAVQEEMKLHAPKSDMWNKLYGEQFALKFLVNSIYGVLGHESYRLYDPRVANAITLEGRILVLKLRDLCVEKGFVVLYGDTDSIFVAVDSAEEAVYLEVEINKFLAVYSEELGSEYPMIVEFEKYYKTLIFKKKVKRTKRRAKRAIAGAKKIYSGYMLLRSGKPVDPERALDVVGAKKSSTALLTQKVLEGVQRAILVEEDVKKALNIVREAWDNFEDLPLEQIGIPRSIRASRKDYKVPSLHFRSSEYMMVHYGWLFRQDESPKLIYVKKVPEGKPYTKAITFQSSHKIPEGFEVDWAVMREKVIKSTVETIIEATGYDWTSIFQGGRQATLIEY